MVNIINEILTLDMENFHAEIIIYYSKYLLSQNLHHLVNETHLSVHDLKVNIFRKCKLALFGSMLEYNNVKCLLNLFMS